MKSLHAFRIRFAVLATAVLLVACSGRKSDDEPLCINPTAPSCETTAYDPPANPSQYEPVGTVHRLLDANGKQTKMWAKLLAEPNPPRGAGITLGPSVCPDGCFRFHMEMGFDAVPNPHTRADMQVRFDSGKYLTGRILSPGTSQTTDPTLIYGAFENIPKALVVNGSYQGDIVNGVPVFPSESGEATFLLDYRQR